MDKIFIAGAGGIGRAAALLMLDNQTWDCEVVLADASESQLNEAKAWIEKGLSKKGRLVTFVISSVDDVHAFENILSGCNVMLDCLPGKFAPALARLCLEYGLHYANLTEYVKESAEITEMAADAETGFILQTGLAPGYVNSVALHLIESFKKKYGAEKLERLAMRVGALTQYTESPHYYGFTWSTIGVATEYIKPSEAVRNHEIVELPSLSERETLIINGKRYEADLTSGGAADLPKVLKEEIRNIDYKTIRYPGHYEWVQAWLKNDTNPESKIERLEKYLVDNVPHVEDDVIVIYASVTGYDQSGQLRSIQHAQHIYPMMFGSITMRAIQICTAAPLVECARLLLTGEYQGVIHQSDIYPAAILEGVIVKQAYHSEISE
ncbi:MAG TPA: saccharopine dehydrogenase C-terminal domain-containing protein [Saprospiraceae bacterium]|nr:saccharopine dehydrogenase C-terminal domain-containing protein [Saprospiraceae bacterium]